jgi:protein tyrosine/serine phosphatase
VRGSAFGSLTDAGRDAMRAHGIRTVIDLRGPDEVAEVRSPYAEGATYRHVTFIHGRTMGLHRAAADATMSAELRRLAEPESGLREIVREIARATPGTLIHCLAGRDRTGIVVAVVLAAIGVPDEEIVADYVASDAELADEYERFTAERPELRAEIFAAIERRAWTMEQVLATIRTDHGDGAGYLRSAGVAPEDVDLLRAKLVG